MTNNTAVYGGGVSISATTATLTNSSITGNTGSGSVGGGGGAGGAYISVGNTATLTNNSITGNTAKYNGGVSIRLATTATLTNNSITGNTGDYFSGGVEIVVDNTATLTNNSITGNTAKYDGGGGATIYATTATLTNNSITGNTAPWGGGLRLRLGDTEATDTAKLYNNLFWDNVATSNEGADLWIDNDGDDDYFPTPVTLLANNFDQAQPTGFSSTLPITIDPSNLNKLDPLFFDASTGDLHLQPGSPMIDAGYPATPDLPDFDIEGTPRVLGASVDIGAYEYDEDSPLLSLTLAGTSSGMVTSSPTGINCGSDCFQAYDIDTLVTLTATPATGSTFTGWSGACTGLDACTLTMDAAQSVTATFSLPTLKINNVSKVEGNSGTTAFTFTVTLSPASTGTVRVKYATANGTATAGSDYTALPATLLTFSPGQTSQQVTVNVSGDTTPEANETFFVNLSAAKGATLFDGQGLGTLLNDEGPVLKINNVSKAEGNSGTTAYTFTVTLSPASTGTVKVKYATANGTATAGSDYTAIPATLLTPTVRARPARR
ncbi:MAG: hypothetical protein KAX51_09685 [Chromatiaceae bacterium]|nr:hypothetical protein [Chromatiaceae bacterium]